MDEALNETTEPYVGPPLRDWSWQDDRTDPMDQAARDRICAQQARRREVAAGYWLAESFRGGEVEHLSGTLPPDRLRRYAGCVDWWMAQVAEPAAAVGINLYTREAFAFAILMLCHGVDPDRRLSKQDIADGRHLRQGTNRACLVGFTSRLVAALLARQEVARVREPQGLHSGPIETDGYWSASPWRAVTNLRDAANTNTNLRIVL